MRARAGTKGVDLKYFVESKEYQLVGIHVTAKTEYYSCCPEPFRTLNYEFEIRRYAITYVTSIIIPLISTTFIGFFAYALNPASGERVGLCTTVLLTTAAIYIVAAEMIPKVGHWTLLSRMYIVCLFANLFTFIVTCVSIMLTMLSNQAESNRDFWGLPVFNRLVDSVFWHLHVGVMLRRERVVGGGEKEEDEEEKRRRSRRRRIRRASRACISAWATSGSWSVRTRSTARMRRSRRRRRARAPRARRPRRGQRGRGSTMTGAADQQPFQLRRTLAARAPQSEARARRPQARRGRARAHVGRRRRAQGPARGRRAGHHARGALLHEELVLRLPASSTVCFFLMPALSDLPRVRIRQRRLGVPGAAQPLRLQALERLDARRDRRERASRRPQRRDHFH